MKFTKIRLNTGAINVDLPIVGASPSDTYILKAADGLGPTEQNVAILNGVYQGRRPSPREIVMRIGLNPNYGINQTPTELRDTLYSLLAARPGDSLKVQLMDGGTISSQAEGQADKIEIVPFAPDPEVQLTVACLDANLKFPSELTIIPTTKAVVPVDYVGTAPVGFKMQIIFTGVSRGFTIVADDGTFMEFDHTFNEGDLLILDTREGSREITVLEGSFDDYNCMGDLTQDSGWIKFFEGINHLRMSSSAYNWVELVYQPEFMGV